MFNYKVTMLQLSDLGNFKSSDLTNVFANSIVDDGIELGAWELISVVNYGASVLLFWKQAK